MGKKVLVGAGILVVVIVGYLLYYIFYQTRQLSPGEVVFFSGDNVNLSLDYCRPSKRGRVIFGEDPKALQPHGEYWRMGANQATRFSTDVNLTIHGKQLPPGSYSLYAYPGESFWVVAFNTTSDRWGARPPDPDEDVLRLEVPIEKLSSEVEVLTFSFIEDESPRQVMLAMEWDNVALSIPIEY